MEYVILEPCQDMIKEKKLGHSLDYHYPLSSLFWIYVLLFGLDYNSSDTCHSVETIVN